MFENSHQNTNSNDAAEEKYKNTKDEGLRDMIASCKSLSKYEGKSLKNVLPQVNLLIS